MKGLTLNQKEQARLVTLNRVLEGQLSVKDAGGLLGVSERHAWRLLAAYRKEGAAALAHGSRGRRPKQAIPEGTRAQVVRLARTTYAGVNHTHFTELLAEREGIELSRSTVRRILVAAGVPSPRNRRSPRHRLRRPRFPQQGMLLQVDGSDHDWLEERGPRLSLLLAVDDATGEVPWALFRPEEDSHGYLTLLEGIIERHGIPLALYSDRHSVFYPARRCNEGGRSQNGRRERTQFGRAMGELGVAVVLARSPEGKGRVERAAGTLQDRLVSELRLAGASTLEAANQVLWAYLPPHNERFSVPAAQPGSAYRPVPSGLALQDVLCFKHRRKVAKDNTVKYRWRTLQLLPSDRRGSYAGSMVEVRERLDGTLAVADQEHEIPVQEVPHSRTVFTQASQGHNGLMDGQGLTEELTRFLPTPLEIATLPPAPDGRKPTPKKIAYWEAIQEAKGRGLGIRAIARELGISRNTVRKYLRAPSPPINRRRTTAPPR